MKILSSQELSTIKAGKMSIPDILVANSPGISGAAMGYGGIGGALVSYWASGSAALINGYNAYNANNGQ